jgi:hypothetical protein
VWERPLDCEANFTGPHQVIRDGVYVELVAFTHPIEHYPEGSEERSRRESNPWASKLPGWIDYAFLGTSPIISKIINSRAQEEGSGVKYLAEVPGGRETPAGKVLKWLITGPDPTSIAEGAAKNGSLPFFCGDVTSREWRVRAHHIYLHPWEAAWDFESCGLIVEAVPGPHRTCGAPKWCYGSRVPHPFDSSKGLGRVCTKTDICDRVCARSRSK